MVKQRSVRRNRSKRKKQLKGGNPLITYPLIIAGLLALGYIFKGTIPNLKKTAEEGKLELQGNAAALARRAGDDLFKKDREKLRLEIAALHRALDPEDQLDDIDRRGWMCDYNSDPIYCLNEIITELENIAFGAKERERLKKEAEFRTDYKKAQSGVDSSEVNRIIERKRKVEVGENPSDLRDTYVEGAIELAKARTIMGKKTLRQKVFGRTKRKRKHKKHKKHRSKNKTRGKGKGK